MPTRTARMIQSSLYVVHYQKPLGPSIDWVSVPQVFDKGEKSVFEQVEWSESVKTYPGSYLAVNFSIMIMFCFACLMTMTLSVLTAFEDIETNGLAKYEWHGIPSNELHARYIAVVSAMALIVVLLRLRKLRWRRRILESGFLSINSCAVLWNVSIHAHFRAVDALEDKRSFQGYCDKLAEQADAIIEAYKANGTDGLNDWIGEDGTESHTATP